MLKLNKYTSSLIGTITLASILAVAFWLYDNREVESVSKPTINTFADIKIESRSAYVYDLKKGQVLYSKDSTAQLPLASITKIMSAIVALEEAPENLIVETSDTLLAERGGGDIYANERWWLKDIIDFLLVTSSNDAAHAIASAVGALDSNSANKPAEEIFVNKMNKKAKELGLNQTYFINPSGLDISRDFSGAYGSAKDAATLISYAYLKYPESIESTSEKRLYVQSLSGIIHNVENTNEIAGNLPGLSASKTGFTDLAGGNLAVILEAGPGRPIAIAVLGSSREGRFEDVKKLYQASLNHINLNDE